MISLLRDTSQPLTWRLGIFWSRRTVQRRRQAQWRGAVQIIAAPRRIEVHIRTPGARRWSFKIGG